MREVRPGPLSVLVAVVVAGCAGGSSGGGAVVSSSSVVRQDTAVFDARSVVVDSLATGCLDLSVDAIEVFAHRYDELTSDPEPWGVFDDDGSVLVGIVVPVRQTLVYLWLERSGQFDGDGAVEAYLEEQSVHGLVDLDVDDGWILGIFHPDGEGGYEIADVGTVIEEGDSDRVRHFRMYTSWIIRGGYGASPYLWQNHSDLIWKDVSEVCSTGVAPTGEDEDVFLDEVPASVTVAPRTVEPSDLMVAAAG